MKEKGNQIFSDGETTVVTMSGGRIIMGCDYSGDLGYHLFDGEKWSFVEDLSEEDEEIFTTVFGDESSNDFSTIPWEIKEIIRVAIPEFPFEDPSDEDEEE